MDVEYLIDGGRRLGRGRVHGSVLAGRIPTAE
jgi:hypothetical protein